MKKLDICCSVKYNPKHIKSWITQNGGKLSIVPFYWKDDREFVCYCPKYDEFFTDSSGYGEIYDEVEDFKNLFMEKNNTNYDEQISRLKKLPKELNASIDFWCEDKKPSHVTYLRGAIIDRRYFKTPQQLKTIIDDLIKPEYVPEWGDLIEVDGYRDRFLIVGIHKGRIEASPDDGMNIRRYFNASETNIKLIRRIKEND